MLLQSFAMTDTLSSKELLIKKATDKIILDGMLDEKDWQSAEIANNFYQHYPYDTAYSKAKTEVKVTYDNQFIYIGAVCYNDLPGNFVVQSLKRDFDFNNNDAFAISFDTYGQSRTAFCFAVSPLGVQVEGLITNGGSWNEIRTDWESKWFSKVIVLENKWQAEIAIPFKSLRYNENVSEWRINFLRNDLKRNEKSSWSRVPKEYSQYFLAYNGKMVWDNTPNKAGANISVIPYFTGSIGKDYESDEKVATKPNAGLDAKIAVTSSLNLDLTFNPDFSQVDVDKQTINLTRFSLFVPEKRNFFLENQDLFGEFGFRQIRPFFSKRIGLYAINDWQYEPVPILTGARLSGNINSKLRIGILNAQTAPVSKRNIDSQNYTVAVLQKNIVGNSFLSLIIVNRQAFPLDTNKNDGKKKYFFDKNNFNRVGGGEYLYVSKNNKVIGKVFYVHSLTPSNYRDNYSHASWLMYNSKKIWGMWNHEYVGENFLADAGFVPRIYYYDEKNNITIRQAYWRIEPFIQYKIYPSSGIINTHGPGISMDYYFDKDFNYTDLNTEFYYKFKFQDLSEFTGRFKAYKTRLQFDTDITGTLDSLLPASEYFYEYFEIRFNSSMRYKVFGNINASYGEFFNGTKLSVNGEINFRLQPWGVLALNFSHDNVKLPIPYNNADLTLIGPKLELSFSKSLFFTTYIQYNNQINNLNINSRFQWRFKPMSDLFIVYSDNYLSDNFMVKNRALVLKFVYWFTV